jgi:hypothetical protein
MGFFPQAFPPTPCALLYPPPFAPHALPISFVSILPPAQYWVRSTDLCHIISETNFVLFLNTIPNIKKSASEEQVVHIIIKYLYFYSFSLRILYRCKNQISEKRLNLKPFFKLLSDFNLIKTSFSLDGKLTS